MRIRFLSPRFLMEVVACAGLLTGCTVPTGVTIPDGKSSKTLRIPAPPNFGSMDAKSKDEDAKESRGIPALLTLTASPIRPLVILPSQSDSKHSKIVTVLSGDLKIRTVEPAFDVTRLSLFSATSARLVSGNIDGCAPSSIRFTKPGSGLELSFSISAEDPKPDAGSVQCLPKIAELAHGGFTVELQNVQIGPVLGGGEVQSVLIHVEPTEAAPQRSP